MKNIFVLYIWARGQGHNQVKSKKKNQIDEKLKFSDLFYHIETGFRKYYSVFILAI